MRYRISPYLDYAIWWGRGGGNGGDSKARKGSKLTFLNISSWLIAPSCQLVDSVVTNDQAKAQHFPSICRRTGVRVSNPIIAVNKDTNQDNVIDKQEMVSHPTFGKWPLSNLGIKIIFLVVLHSLLILMFIIGMGQFWLEHICSTQVISQGIVMSSTYLAQSVCLPRLFTIFT